MSIGFDRFPDADSEGFLLSLMVISPKKPQRIRRSSVGGRRPRGKPASPWTRSGEPRPPGRPHSEKSDDRDRGRHRKNRSRVTNAARPGSPPKESGSPLLVFRRLCLSNGKPVSVISGRYKRDVRCFLFRERKNLRRRSHPPPFLFCINNRTSLLSLVFRRARFPRKFSSVRELRTENIEINMWKVLLITAALQVNLPSVDGKLALEDELSSFFRSFERLIYSPPSKETGKSSDGRVTRRHPQIYTALHSRLKGGRVETGGRSEPGGAGRHLR